MRRLFAALVLAGLACAAILYVVTLPRGLPQAALAALPEGDASRGETWFWAGGCGSCHSASGAKGADRLLVGGGRVLATPFGDFTVPNISMHPTDGIGGWSAADFTNAVLRGASPDGRHYYPAFPYASYIRMQTADVADLWAFFRTLPEVAGVQPGHALGFPFNIRQGIGLWKLAFLSGAPAVTLDTSDPAVARGQYLVEGAGHCGECHTPRNLAGAVQTSRWLGGAPAPTGGGRIPNITGGAGGLGDWSAADIAYFFESGFTPDYDSVGGTMVEVQENLAMLTPGDREAIAAYLKAIPPHDAVK